MSAVGVIGSSCLDELPQPVAAEGGDDPQMSIRSRLDAD
jgi:hypothetical protein